MREDSQGGITPLIGMHRVALRPPEGQRCQRPRCTSCTSPPVADVLWHTCPAAATVGSGSSACVVSSGHATCASAASTWGSQKVMFMAWYRAMAAANSVRACSRCPVMADSMPRPRRQWASVSTTLFYCRRSNSRLRDWVAFSQ